ncbi:MAG: UDP-N-acetylglucosamine 2-epimerase, partial [Planctomycetaceae bacterium]
MRTVCVVTVGRSDWGLYLPILRCLREQSDLRLHLIASGAHLAAGHGRTDAVIAADGFEIDERVPMLLASDDAAGIAISMGLGTLGFAQVYQRVRPDLLLVLGDRFEMHAAAAAAVPFRLPTAHVHGGEVTAGAIDDCFRHAITKYSHLHFASTAEHGRRIVQLGEEPWRVTVSGAPGLDHLGRMRLLGVAE